MSTSIYVHIPFCEHICHYCDFNKVFLENQPVEDYIDALIKEISVSKQAKKIKWQLRRSILAVGHLQR